MSNIRAATLDDLRFIDSLRKVEGDALGFIPLQRYEQIVGGQRDETLLIVEENDDRAGFLYATHGGALTRIVQIGVCNDARRLAHGQALIGEMMQEAIARAKFAVKARVAHDLESNKFWQAMGFGIVGEATGTFLNRWQSPKKRPLHIYERPLVARLPGF